MQIYYWKFRRKMGIWIMGLFGGYFLSRIILKILVLIEFYGVLFYGFFLLAVDATDILYSNKLIYIIIYISLYEINKKYTQNTNII
jgi:hypothetical protein